MVEAKAVAADRTRGMASRWGRRLGAGIAVLLAGLALDQARGQGRAAAEDRPLRIVNDTDLTIRFPATAALAEGCGWVGSEALLGPGETMDATIVPAQGRRAIWPCRLSLEASLPGLSAPGTGAGLAIDLAAPDAGAMTAALHYSYDLGEGAGASGMPRVSVPVALTALPQQPDGGYRLDLAPLGDWIAQNLP